MLYKLYNNLVALNFVEFFAYNNCSITRGHDSKLVKPLCVNNARQFSFSCRLVDAWNFLPNCAVSSNSLIAFKNMLDNCNLSKFLLI